MYRCHNLLGISNLRILLKRSFLFFIADIKVELDPGTKSEGEEDKETFLNDKKSNLVGRTPNHLTLSTTSTISTGSTGSQAKLIHSSQQPENYQPAAVKELGKYTIFYDSEHAREFLSIFLKTLSTFS